MNREETTDCRGVGLRGGQAGFRGFTLIELLVVVAIIALLIAILTPSLKQARWQTRVVVCKAHLHDLGNAFNMYTEAFSGYYPLTAGSGMDSYFALGYRTPGVDGKWKSSYLKDLDILICPATKNRIRPETLTWPVQYDTYSENGSSVVEKIPFMSPNSSGSPISDIDDAAVRGPNDASGGHSYEYNGCYDSSRKDASGRHISPLSSHHKRSTHFLFPPAQMVLVHDNDDNEVVDRQQDLGCENSRWGGNNCPQPWDNHNQYGMNMMFGDGHADWMKKQPGTYLDFTDANRPPTPSKNASIDRVFLKSQYPWEYIGRY